MLPSMMETPVIHGLTTCKFWEYSHASGWAFVWQCTNYTHFFHLHIDVFSIRLAIYHKFAILEISHNNFPLFPKDKVVKVGWICTKFGWKVYYQSYVASLLHWQYPPIFSWKSERFFLATHGKAHQLFYWLCL